MSLTVPAFNSKYEIQNTVQVPFVAFLTAHEMKINETRGSTCFFLISYVVRNTQNGTWILFCISYFLLNAEWLKTTQDVRFVFRDTD